MEERTSPESSFDSNSEDAGVPCRVYELTMIVCLLSLTMGMDVGINPALGYLVKEEYGLDDVEAEIYISMIAATAVIGASFAWVISDQYGRTKTILIAANMKIVGSLLVAIGQSWVISIIGRALSGIGYGLGFSVDSIYVSEIVPSRHRGRFISYVEFARKFGILVGILIGWGFSSTTVASSWQWMGGLLLIPSAILLIVCFFMPETPRWHMIAGHTDQARDALSQLLNDEQEIEDSLNDMQVEIETSDTSWNNVLCSKDKVFKRMVLTVLFAAFLEEMSGIHVIIFYTPFILELLGETYEESMIWLVVVVTVLVVVIVVGMFLLDHRDCGRRIMIMISCAGTCAVLIGLAVSTYFESQDAVIAMLVSHAAFYSLGLGPGVLLLITETIPLYARAKVVSVAQVVGRGTSLLNAATFLTLTALIGETAIFSMYAFFMLLGTIWAYFLPTTRGRRLESMRRLYAK